MRKFFGLCLVAIAAGFIGIRGSASALTANYNSIIDDAIFDNANSMNANQIDAFLNTFPNSCISTNNGFRAPDPTGYTPANKFTYGPDVSAGTVIYHAAQAYNINPEVIITTLQKEQGLVIGDGGNVVRNGTDCGALAISASMGYTCTDSGGLQPYSGFELYSHNGTSVMSVSNTCVHNAAYVGFSRQVINATWMLTFDRHRSEGQNNWYVNKPGWDNSDDLDFCYSGYDAAGGPYYLCPDQASHASDPFVSHGGQYLIDSTVVTIANGATAALYVYTPHLHGQDLFATNFTNWFGPTTSLMNGVTMTNITQPDPSPSRGETVQYVFSLTDTFSFPITLDAVGVVGRLGSVTGSTNRDFGWQGPVTLQPNVPQQFTFISTLADTGTLYVWPAVSHQGMYTHYNNWGASLSIHEPNISLVSPLMSSTTSPVAGQTVTFSATVQNNEPHAINASAIGIPVRYYGRYSYDTAWSAPSGLSIGPGATYVLSGDVLLDKSGPYVAWVSGLIASRYTTLSPNLNIDAATPTPKFSLTYIETPNATPALGEDITVKFKLKNNSGIPMTLNAVGVVGRYGSPSSSTSNDLGWVGPITFADGEEKSFTSFASNVSDVKNYYAWVAINYQGSYTHYSTWGFTMVPHYPDLAVSVPISVNSGTKPSVGQTVPVTATIENHEPRAIRYIAIGIPIRYYGTYNYDAVWQGPGTLAPSGQAGNTVALNGSVTFDKPGPYTLWASINLPNGKYLTIGTPINMSF